MFLHPGDGTFAAMPGDSCPEMFDPLVGIEVSCRGILVIFGQVQDLEIAFYTLPGDDEHIAEDDVFDLLFGFAAKTPKHLLCVGIELDVTEINGDGEVHILLFGARAMACVWHVALV
jgi:hypothetical protein